MDRANNHEGTQSTARHFAKCFWSGLLVGRCLRSSLRCRGGCGEGVAQGQLSSLFCFCPEFSCRYKRCCFFLPVLNYLRLLTQDSSPQYTRTINLDSMGQVSWEALQRWSIVEETTGRGRSCSAASLPWAPKTMKNRGFGHLKTRLFTIKASKHVGLGGPWFYILNIMLHFCFYSAVFCWQIRIQYLPKAQVVTGSFSMAESFFGQVLGRW